MLAVNLAAMPHPEAYIPSVAALFSPRYGSSELYVLVDSALNRVVAGTDALAPVSTVPFAPAVGAGRAAPCSKVQCLRFCPDSWISC